MNQHRSPLTRRSFIKLLGTAAVAAPFVTRGWAASSPNGKLGHASFGASGMAWADLTEIAKSPRVELVAAAEVDITRTGELKKKFPAARIYQDWREMLEKEGRRIDSVNVSTPDHMHAVGAMASMQLGKHVYVEKPLAHDLFEVRRLTEQARQRKLVSQMGIQINSSMHYRTATQLVHAGTIGKIKEVHSWCSKTWGDPAPLPSTSDTPPEGLDWNLWQGPCAERPFIGGGYYHPGNWRKRLDFGTGTFGDMGCHIFDPVFTALELKKPLTVRSEGPAPNQWNWPIDCHIEYVFEGTAHTTDSKVRVVWYDGAATPAAEVVQLLEGDPLPGTGSILIGTQGTMLIPHISRPILYPDKKFESFKYPEIASSDHWLSFVDACLDGGRTTANFDYSGPLTEGVLLGGVACRFPKTTLKWNMEKLSFDLPEANEHVRREYRAGWQVKGLS